MILILCLSNIGLEVAFCVQILGNTATVNMVVCVSVLLGSSILWSRPHMHLRRHVQIETIEDLYARHVPH